MMDLTLALLLLLAVALGYGTGYAVGWTDHRAGTRRK